jgi:PAS domain S-box-containing protein
MTTPLRVLMIEDSPDDEILVLNALQKGGFEPTHRRVEDRASFVAALSEAPWDVILSDYSMPRFDGLTAFEVCRSTGLDVPFIFVSGHIGEERAVEAMRRGVSDYLRKDNLGRLAAAVHRELQEAASRRQKREMAEALHASEERLQRITQNVPDIIFEYALQPEPHFSFVSSAARTISGFTPEQHLADPGLWLRIVHAEDRALLAELLRTGTLAGRSGGMMRWTTLDGAERWIELHSAPVLDDDQRQIAVEGIVRDITDRKLLEAQFLAAQRMEAIGRLAGGIAHDFNNMLTVIGSYCSLLRRRLSDQEDALSDLGKIESATERSASLVRQLLTFSRRQPRDLRVLDFCAVLTEFAPMFKRLIGEDIQVVIYNAVDKAHLRADRSQLEQVLMNLVVNARDAMPEGGRIAIETDTLDVEELVTGQQLSLRPGRYLRLSVSDTGVGMSQAVQAHIFDPFFTTKAVGTGTGLGLSTVYGIVKQMEGDIWVYSEEGIGTTFKIYLPLAQADALPAGRASGHRDFSGRGTILLVEDETMVREAAERILASHGYTILAAASGEDALQLLLQQERAIDLLLTDLVMPGMNGIDLTRRARARLPDLKVLFTTGFTDVPLEGLDGSGASIELLQKPYGAQNLLEQVQALLTRGIPAP